MLACLLLILAMATVSADDLTKHLLEDKYESTIVFIETLDLAKDLKYVRFDWQKSWWGSFAIIKYRDGKPYFTYDIDKYPTGQSLRDAALIDIDGKQLLKVTDLTHMGNGMTYFYRFHRGQAYLVGKFRHIAQLGSIRFKKDSVKISYVDINRDGHSDIEIIGTVMDHGESDDDPIKEVGPYRVSLIQNSNGYFLENKARRLGRAMLHNR